MPRVETIGNATLYLGDCREILPGLDKSDCLLTDPPYGIGLDKGFQGFQGFGGFGKKIARRQYDGDWDKKRPDAEIIEQCISSAEVAIVFGGNYFTDILPVNGHWFVWDKNNTMPSFSDGELIWTNISKKSVKILRFEYNGLIGKREERVHPTQKPVGVIEWCACRVPQALSFLDPFMGSGTTGVACANLGRKFVGIEIDEKYFDIACERIQRAYDQPSLFVETPKPKPVQEPLDL